MGKPFFRLVIVNVENGYNMPGIPELIQEGYRLELQSLRVVSTQSYG